MWSPAKDTPTQAGKQNAKKRVSYTCGILKNKAEIKKEKNQRKM